jgi:hypothetical protein
MYVYRAIQIRWVSEGAIIHGGLRILSRVIERPILYSAQILGNGPICWSDHQYGLFSVFFIDEN